MAKKRDYKLNPPENLSQLNKESMLHYVDSLDNIKELEWFIGVLDKNREKKTYKFDTRNGAHKKGDELDGYNLPPIRRAFASRYFPDLIKEKVKAPKKTFDEQVEELRKKLKK